MDGPAQRVGDGDQGRGFQGHDGRVAVFVSGADGAGSAVCAGDGAAVCESNACEQSLRVVGVDVAVGLEELESRSGLHDGQARPDLVYVGAVLFPVETDMPAVSADQDDGGLFDEQSFGGERRGPSVPEHAVFRGLAVVCPGEGQRYRSVKTDICFLLSPRKTPNTKYVSPKRK